MSTSSRGTVTNCIDGLKKGSEGAAQELWNRYFAQLMAIARHQLRSVPRDVDAEDIALSALKSAMLGVRNNRFPDLTDRTGLWPLLVTITSRKAINEMKRQRTKKRDRAAEKPMADVQLIVGSEPGPDFSVRLAEAIRSLVCSLGDETLQTIARRKLEGYANEDIAKELQVSTRTVVRKLGRIRQEWNEAT
jgi:DNA-directed RNA polymerase specialized sigma24 family protein